MDEMGKIWADAVMGDNIVEVKHGTHSARDLRAAIMQLSYQLVDRPEKRGFLVLVDSRLTRERLDEEMDRMRQVMRGDILTRIDVVWYTGETPEWFPEGLGNNVINRLNELVRKDRPVIQNRDSYYSILQVLVVLWFRQALPVTRTRLMELTGMSYPTVAKALERLNPFLSNTSDRSVEFDYFPGDEWKKLVAVSSRIRSTKRFAAPQGMTRPVEQLISRLREIRGLEIGIGGVAGGEYYFPDLDLVGLPRLDLSVNSRGVKPDLGFVYKLDPALEPVEDQKRAADVVVHFFRRKESLFIKRDDGLSWADQVECLLDLHEAGFTKQGEELLKYLKEGRQG